MKFINKICGISLLAFLIMLAAPNISRAQEGSYVSDQEFYDELSPYGTWVDDPNYGNVWIPDAEDGFRPYATQGHWIVTDYGNTWVSDYPWGWAAFHYGRWRYDDYYGWEWIPGNEWAPAWVSWRSGGGYYGWAPLQPGISINVSFGSSYNPPDDYWVCAPQAYINRPNIYNYYVPHTRVVNIIHRTTIINNTYVYNNHRYVAGPRVEDIRRVTRGNVNVYKINNVNPTRGSGLTNNTVNIYRPQIKKTPDARPSRVVNGSAYKNEHPDAGIANRGSGQATVNRNNSTKLAQTARSEKPDAGVVSVNRNRPERPAGTDNNKRPDAATAKPNNANPADSRRQGQSIAKPGQQPGSNATIIPQRQQQQARQEQAQQQQRAQKQQQDQQQANKQEAQQREQQAAQRQPQQAQRQQQQQEQQAQQRQQQAAQKQQEQQVQRQQQQNQRQQQQQEQQAQQRQQQAAQKQQEQVQRQQQQQAQRQQQQSEQQAQQRQQQAAQKQQEQAQRQQQQQAQRQQQQSEQQAQQRQQQAAQKQQEQAQRQQQQHQQEQQPARPPRQ